MQLTNLQKETVEEILGHYHPDIKGIKVDFKAPTGSGKTLMASYFISSLIESYSSKKYIFVIATPSSSSLPEFFEKKINIYKTDLPFSRFEVEYIASPSNAKSDNTEYTPKIIPQQNKVYIFGKASFGRGRIFSERSVIDDFIMSAIDRNYDLIYIRDEAHIGDRIDNSDETKKFEQLMQNNASFILKMTATPNYKDMSIKRIELSENDLNNPNKNEGRYLLKTKPQLLLKKDMADTQMLDDAIKNFKKIKTEYEKLDVNIKPAMLIQVDNSSADKDKKKVFEDALSDIKKTLKNSKLSWVQYFGNNDKDSDRTYKDKFNLDEITQGAKDDIDAIIFKIGPSTGWDIPRACMLLQLRNVCSSSLNTQTIGRIKRNPYPNLEKNEITDKYYVYSNAQNTDKDFKVYNYEVKELFREEEFASVKIGKKSLKNNLPPESIKIDIEKYLASKNFLQEYNGVFDEIDKVFTYKKPRQIINGNLIYTPISNPFIFLKEYERLMRPNGFLYETLQKYTNAFYSERLKDGISNIEFFNAILFERHRKNLLDIVSKNRSYQMQYEIEMKTYDPSIYSELQDSAKQDKIKRLEEGKASYLFNVKNGEKDIQPFDSEPEKIVFQEICNYIKYEEDKIKVWAKNLTTSNISGEYLDENNNERHSYFDFIIKFVNGTFLYIEVKSEEDIDPNKTDALKEAYENYFSKTQKGLFDNFIISIWKVGKNGIKQESFYDKTRIMEDLNSLTPPKLLKKLGDRSLR